VGLVKQWAKNRGRTEKLIIRGFLGKNVVYEKKPLKKCTGASGGEESTWL